ncbi:YhcN/YlaJ family sporulation lipoprotein [Halalkalibacter urbisdiaboli]|uniref:YhcN/YlaJ family sporulation lipoprotein n=1 Tax=Halalkalibacter urbisdiaboli TaxID=1960589 RepID=UPI000B454324|nr:YhcN/YlaJ family sporulation lipoprotein [Halalkalibacter urbisdiaboli]
MSKMLIRFLCLLTLLAGCQGVTGQSEEVRPLMLGEKPEVSQNKADEAKQIVLSMDEVLEVKGVELDDDIYIAPRVKQFDRFHLKGIRKEGHDHIKKRYPDANVHVSTDRKIYMELEKLEKQLKENKLTEKQLKEKVKKLEDDMKG